MPTSAAASSLGLPALHPSLEADLSAGLGAVEELLRADVTSDYPLVTEAARHLVDAGGKRFRPLLTLLAAQFGDAERDEVRQAAVVVELTHLASLYHDDVMDEATLRRGAPSTNVRFGNSVSILVGDFLFARAAARVADLGPEAVRIQARTFERLVVGQIRETEGPRGGDPLEHYLAVLADKTGSLIATSGRLGALQAGAGEGVAEVLTRYGELVGVAFQLADDLLDVESDSAVSGKAVGTDLREGVETLPVLCFRRIADAADPEDGRLLALLDGDLADDAALAEAVQRLRAHRALGDAHAEVRRWADRARAELAPLAECPAKEALDALCAAVVERAS
ncbi:heptaprenyl diphosphate synthase [Motilibacter rhizosphaerae]|uniref:Heptaprenyl diphosphate synthase n=1 Tax=Motilibacter rhizosphaerae TaxID=598652 RepID=A0A4Q7NAB7_9ACTN|nr:polyprenyl synthetase family protein [Motilibacter rhizosphaerae]RZS79007.1 heptaprenyl diphosphate synthase [Motilibacter rhizosphaerae]